MKLAQWTSRLVALLAATLLAGCGYNDFQRLDEEVKAGWSEVLNQYQRRSDLIPNIVATVKGEANFEQETLTKVVEARAKATSIQATPELINNPEAFNKFQAAQGELSGALSRLMMITENYPNLKANQGFQDLRVQLEGTENRITVARNRYIKTVQSYNTCLLYTSSQPMLQAGACSCRVAGEKPGFTSRKRSKCMIEKDFSGFPLNLWITLWGSCGQSRQVLDSASSSLACPIWQRFQKFI